jgi:hypothetical protein
MISKNNLKLPKHRFLGKSSSHPLPLEILPTLVDRNPYDMHMSNSHCHEI